MGLPNTFPGLPNEGDPPNVAAPPKAGALPKAGGLVDPKAEIFKKLLFIF